MTTILRMTGVASEQSRGRFSRARVGDGHALWIGRSGRRHVFSRLEAADGDDLDGAVLLLARRDDDGELVAERLISSADRPPRLDGREVWVHWLAETEAARGAVIADLAFRPDDLGTRAPAPPHAMAALARAA
jgi:hypothetical protein